MRRGCQRAGALARFVCPIEKTHATELKLITVFAARAGPSSKSKHSMQTVTPLVSLLRETLHVNYVTTYLKDDGQALMADVLTRAGIVLIAWEHKVLPSLIGHMSRSPIAPATWPDARFDVVSIFDRTGTTGHFRNSRNCYVRATPPRRSASTAHRREWRPGPGAGYVTGSTTAFLPARSVASTPDYSILNIG